MSKKWLFKFDIIKEIVEKEESTSTNDKGEEVTIKKDVISKKPITFCIQKPNRRMYEQGGKKDQYPSWADENKGVTDARDLDEDQQRALFFANTFMQRIDKTPGKADNLIYDVAMNRRDKSKFTELYGGTHYKDPSGVLPDSTRNKINDVFSNIE